MKLIAAIRKAAKIAQQHNAALVEVDRLFYERYGARYNDIDCDLLIDAVDYGRGMPFADLKSLDNHVYTYTTLAKDKK